MGNMDWPFDGVRIGGEAWRTPVDEKGALIEKIEHLFKIQKNYNELVPLYDRLAERFNKLLDRLDEVTELRIANIRLTALLEKKTRRNVSKKGQRR